MTWPLHTKPPRTWVRPLANLGFEVMHYSDYCGARRIGYRHKLEDANALATREHNKALDIIEMVEEALGKEVDILMPQLELWEGENAT